MISEALGLKPLMGERKQKLLSNLLVSLGAFLGFEALSTVVGLYQVRTYVLLSIYLYLFHVLWLTFLYDLHLKKKAVLINFRFNRSGWHLFSAALKERCEHVFNWHYFRHFQNFLVLPAVIYWAVVIILFLNPFKSPTKQLIVIASSLAMSVAYWHFKDFLSRQLEMHEFGVKVLSLVKLYAAFLIFAATLGVSWYFGIDWSFFVLAVFCLTFILIYQALFQHKLLSLNAFPFMLSIGFVVALSGYFIYSYWGMNYLTGGLVIMGVYNTFWGILHHHLEKTLTKKLVFEYLAMLLLILSVIAASQDFTPRID
ncbi:MAG: hypothetical protein HY395_02940 [Candidatus Doudnabacteria bacterium]|nr:hypothetical protein [Candidatus Doudnabacteria bacterium]